MAVYLHSSTHLHGTMLNQATRTILYFDTRCYLKSIYSPSEGYFMLPVLTNSMEQIPLSEVNNGRSTAGQEVPCLLWSPNVCYHVHKSLP
jgi:hypothetical protein